MKLFITGATGFLGRFVVDEALRRGHAVRAVVRTPTSAQKLGWRASDQLEFAAVDLRSRKGLVDALRGVDCVLHLAAQKAGDIYAQFHGTVVTTENLLWAMAEADVRQIVHVSTFSVYDYMKIKAWSVLDESSPVESRPADRDEYAQTKLVQEALVVTEATKRGWRYTVLRPGVIYGRDNLWSARVGLQPTETLWVRTGAWSPVPLNYVENCADAILLSAEKPEANGQTLNVVDDETPRQRDYVRLLRKRMTPRPRVIPVSWTVMRVLARAAWLTNRYVFKDRAKVPGLFSPAKIAARIKPMKFSNAKIKRVLGWAPRHGLNEALDRSLGGHTWIDVTAVPAGAIAPPPREATGASADAERVAT